jgi:hypothetical protein
MHSRLSHYFHTNNILVPEQFGFRKGIPIENAGYKLTDSILNSINQKVFVGGTFCELVEAFACVNTFFFLHSRNNSQVCSDPT